MAGLSEAKPESESSDDKSKRRLGRGLAALIGETASEVGIVEQARGNRKVPIEFLSPNPRNPRQSFDDDDLDDLTRSVREKGIVQPILVRPLDDAGNTYEIIAGERRWRAAQRAGLADVPVMIREVDDREALELAIVENVQRSDLNPVEEAQGYEKLINDFSYTQSDLARVIGKSRSHVANTLRLLKLPKKVQSMMVDGRLTAGHARPLITADDPQALAEQIVRTGLSVRDTEALTQATDTRPSKTKADPEPKDADTLALEKRISDALGMAMTITHNKGGFGTVTIKYKSLDQLDLICRRLEK